MLSPAPLWVDALTHVWPWALCMTCQLHHQPSWFYWSWWGCGKRESIFLWYHCDGHPIFDSGFSLEENNFGDPNQSQPLISGSGHSKASLAKYVETLSVVFKPGFFVFLSHLCSFLWVICGPERPPFEPLESGPERFLTLKSLTSLKRIDDLQALSVSTSCIDFAPSLVKVFCNLRYSMAKRLLPLPTRVLQSFSPPPLK